MRGDFWSIMPRKYTGKISTLTVQRRQKNGDVYVYEEQRQYDPEKKYAVTLSAKLLGVKKKGTNQVVQTRPKRKFVNIDKEEVSPLGDVKAIRKHVGMMDIINHLSETSGVDEDIRSTTDSPTADKIMSLVQFIVCTDTHGLAGIEEWQYTHDLPYKDGINKNIYHTLFKEIGRDETLQQGFLKLRLEREDKVGVYLACDSTQISTYSENLTDDIARYGYDKENDGLPKVKYLVLFSLKTNMPVWFTELPGNIPDVISVSSIIDRLKTLGIKKVTFVTDCGYFSKSNIAEMLTQGYDFVTRADISQEWVRSEIEIRYYHKSVKNVNHACPSDVDIHGVSWDDYEEFEWTRIIGSKDKKLKAGDKDTMMRTVFFHLFFSPERKIAQDREVKNTLFEALKQIKIGIKLDTMKPAVRTLVKKCCDIEYDSKGNMKIEPNQSRFEAYCDYNGLFLLISNKKLDCFECLDWYKRREAIENFFRRAKTDVNMDRTAVWHKDTLHGRMFVQFVALCLYQHAENEIKRIKNSLLETTDADGKPKLKTFMDKEKELFKWLDSRSIVRILNWFDAYDRVEVSVKLRQKRWSTPTTERDRMFLERLGVIPSNLEGK